MFSMKPIYIRAPDELHARVARLAEKAGLSINGWVLTRLTLAVERAEAAEQKKTEKQARVEEAQP